MDDINPSEEIRLGLTTATDQARLLALAVDQSSEGVAIVSLDGSLRYVNAAFAGMHGYAPDEILGKNLTIFHNTEQLDLVNAANRQIIETGEFKGEVWHARADGSVFPTMMHNTLIRDEAGRPIGIIGTMRDISDLRSALSSLRESESKFTTAFMASPVVISISTLDKGRIVEVNQAFQDTTGYQREELIGRTSLELGLWARSSQRAEIIEKLKIYGTVLAEDIFMRCKSGEILTGLFSGAFISIHGQRYLLSQFVDITERKKMERRLKEAARLLEKRVRERTIELKKKTKALEEMNTTLRVLLHRGKKDLRDLEQKVLLNIEATVLPFVRKIRNRKLEPEQVKYLDLVESNLRSATSSFSKELASDLVGLSPGEIQVADLVRRGYSTKDISAALNVSVKTIDVHRLNIRKKLGIAGRRVSLRTYLLSKIDG